MRWTGAKRGAGVWQRIISEMPAHSLYVEGFAGTGWIARKKKWARTIVIDADPAAPAVAMPDRNWLVQVGDVLRILPPIVASAADTGTKVVVYLDPPYLFSTRTAGRKYYRHEFGDERSHSELLDMVQSLRAYVMLSGYDSELYRYRLADWRVVDIPTVDRAGKSRIEKLWCNFPAGLPLHDTRWIGNGYRERERIRRRRSRWLARLERLSPEERQDLLAALNESSRS